MENFDKSNVSGAFISYDEKFFVHRLWKSIPDKTLLESFERDKTITEQERNYFKEEYSLFF